MIAWIVCHILLLVVPNAENVFPRFLQAPRLECRKIVGQALAPTLGSIIKGWFPLVWLVTFSSGFPP